MCLLDRLWGGEGGIDIEMWKMKSDFATTDQQDPKSDPRHLQTSLGKEGTQPDFPSERQDSNDQGQSGTDTLASIH